MLTKDLLGKYVAAEATISFLLGLSLGISLQKGSLVPDWLSNASLIIATISILLFIPLSRKIWKSVK